MTYMRSRKSGAHIRSARPAFSAPGAGRRRGAPCRRANVRHAVPPSEHRDVRLLSAVAPLYDEDATVEAFVARCVEALREVPLELVLVDDGSRDRVKAMWLHREPAGQPVVTVGYHGRIPPLHTGVPVPA
jgi:Glycosyl transferase family 2